MKSLIIISCFIFLLAFTYCENGGKSDAITLVDIEPYVNKMQKMPLSQFTGEIRYVALEKKTDKPLLKIILADFTDKYILVSDMNICLLYDKKGNFLRQIGKPGRGPGEYTGGISLIFISNEKVCLRDFLGYDLIEYNLDGTFIKNHKNSFLGDGKYRLEEAVLLNDSLIFGNIENRTGQEVYKALIIDKRGNIKYSYKNYFRFNLNPGTRSVKSPVRADINKFKNEIFFKEHYNDTLFQLDAKYRLRPAFVFNLGKFKEPLSEKGKNWAERDLLSYIDLYHIFQTDNSLILNCDLNNYFPAKRLIPEIIRIPGHKDITRWINTESIIGIYDKKTGEFAFSEPTSTNNHLFTSGLYNDIDAGPRFIPEKMVNDSTMVMNIRFEYLIEHIESNDFKDNIPKFPDRKEKLEYFVDSLKNTGFDNPVLMFVTYNQ